MNARRSGIIIRMPSRPPSTATSITRTRSISKPRSISAGIVTPTPKAIDSPAEPVVWTMLFSRIVARRVPSTVESARNSVIDSTATGIDAETVIPTLSTRYSDEAPKMMPRIAPAQHRRPRQLRRRRLRRNIRLITGGLSRSAGFFCRMGWHPEPEMVMRARAIGPLPLARKLGKWRLAGGNQSACIVCRPGSQSTMPHFVAAAKRRPDQAACDAR